MIAKKEYVARTCYFPLAIGLCISKMFFSLGQAQGAICAGTQPATNHYFRPFAQAFLHV
jgi:hypothetical protein